MTGFSSIITSLSGTGLYYNRSPRHTNQVFSQTGKSLYRNQPRFPFEYYVAINLNNVGTTKDFISSFFNSTELSQVAPLVKSIDMPSMKIETSHLNQYNRKRITQSRIMFDPIKMVLHDVADGKTLKFWDMYYRYYFNDGREPGVNELKKTSTQSSAYSAETLLKNLKPTINSAITTLPSAIKNVLNGKYTQDASPTNTNGSKQAIQNIVTDTLENQNFGFNIQAVQNIRNLIQSIEIFQVHGGRYNQITLVNPRISAFTHDTLNYGNTDKTLELTFTFECEYVYYNIQNQRLGEGASSKEPFKFGDTLELPSLAFNAVLDDFLETNNPLLKSDNSIVRAVGKNVQSKVTSVTGAAGGNLSRMAGTGVLAGLVGMVPGQQTGTPAPVVQSRPFSSAATKSNSKFVDVNRIIT